MILCKIMKYGIIFFSVILVTGCTSLKEASEQRDSHTLEKLIAKGHADPDVLNDHAEPVLYRAAANGHTETVKILLEGGADPDRPDGMKRTPLMAAASGGYTDIIKLLIEKKANVNAKSASGYSALHRAVISGNRDSVDVLLKAGADPNAADLKGEIPLFPAAARGHTEMVKILMPPKADVFAVNSYGQQAIDVSDNPAIRLLIKKEMDRRREVYRGSLVASQIAGGTITIQLTSRRFIPVNAAAVIFRGNQQVGGGVVSEVQDTFFRVRITKGTPEQGDVLAVYRR